MELTHKTTILFSETQIKDLKKIAKEKKTSMGDLNLPVSDVSSMKPEQTPYKDFDGIEGLNRIEPDRLNPPHAHD